MSKSNQKENYKLLRQLGMLTFIPMILVGSPLAGFLIGKWLDGEFHTGQGITIVLIMLGFAAGMIEAFKIIKKVSSEK